MNVIEYLLPHRPPFLMVESIVSYVGGDAPVLKAECPIRRSEPVFSRAESLSFWPSVYIIEGLGQCSALLSLICTWDRGRAAKSMDVESVSTWLLNMENFNRDYTSEQLLEMFGNDTMKTESRIGLLASVDVVISGQVHAGELLRYRVEQTLVLEGLSRFSVQAAVDEQVVAHGTMVGARMESIS